MRVFDFNSAIVRTPGQSVVNGLRANAGPAPDFEAILAEHRTYVTALGAAGVQVTVLDALEQFPDSIFVEDPALVFSQAAVLLRPGAPTRMAEAQELTATLEARFPAVLRSSSGYADGGDILVTPDRVLIGLSARTNEEGAADLQRLLPSIGMASQVVKVPRGTLHLKTDCSLIDEEPCSRRPNSRIPACSTASHPRRARGERRHQRAARQRHRVHQGGMPAHAGDAARTG